jgi:hypothetical protein
LTLPLVVDAVHAADQTTFGEFAPRCARLYLESIERFLAGNESRRGDRSAPLRNLLTHVWEYKMGRRLGRPPRKDQTTLIAGDIEKLALQFPGQTESVRILRRSYAVKPQATPR